MFSGRATSFLLLLFWGSHFWTIQIQFSFQLYFRCELCGKQLQTKRSYYKHRSWHNAPDNYICDICKREFNAKDTLKYHMHSRHVKWKKCPHCIARWGGFFNFFQFSFLISGKSFSSFFNFFFSIIFFRFSSVEELEAHEKLYHNAGMRWQFLCGNEIQLLK